MRSAYRALIWEQSRVAGVIAAWCTVAGAGVIGVLWLQLALDSINRDLAIDFSWFVYLMTAGGAAVCLVLRFDANGNLVDGFEQRLKRLPVRTVPLATVPFLARFIAIAAMSVALMLLIVALYKAPPAHALLLVPLELFCVAVMVSWSRRAITGWEYLLFLAVLLPAFIGLLHPAAEGYFATAIALFEGAAHPLVFPVVLAVAYAVSVLGVSMERREARVGLPTAREVSVWIAGRGPRVEQRFDSPRAAQVWYEYRRAGRLLPVFTLLHIVGIVPIAMVAAAPHEQLGFALQAAPLFALVLAALPAGLIGLRARSRYMLHRPIETEHIARAKLLVAVRSLLAAVPLVLAFSVLGFFAANTPEGATILRALAEGGLGLFGFLTLFAGPVVLAAALAWVLLWTGTWLTGLQLLSFVIGPATLLFLEVWGIDVTDGPGVGFYWSGVVTVLLMTAVGLSWAKWGRGIRLSHIGFMLVLWAGVTGYFVLLGPIGDAPVPILVQALLPGALIAMPVVGVPAAIHGRRVQ